MGRSVATEQVPVEVVQQVFAIGPNSGDIIRVSTGEPATFTLKGKLLVRIYHVGTIRRIGAGRIAWALASGEWPRGIVWPLDGDDRNFRPSNLTLVPHCGHKPQAKGGAASSLGRRAEADHALILALADADTSLAALALATGRSEARTSTHLGRLAVRGLAESPMCCPTKAWCLTDAGRELAMSGKPLLDALDLDILRIIATSPLQQLALARRVETCSLTIKRRVAPLIARGLVSVDGRRRFSISPEGRQVIGVDNLPQPWVRAELVSAARAKDVAERSRTAEQTAAQRSEQATTARTRRAGKWNFNYSLAG